MRRAIGFVLAGGVGFLADAAGLVLLLAATPLDPFLARLLSLAFALVLTWQVNRRFTFGPSHRAGAVEGARYGGVGIATSLVNYIVYSAALMAMPDFPPICALAIGSAVAMALSYLGYSRLVFGKA